GHTPIFNDPSAVGLSFGSSPTIVQSGDGSTATPYHQAFGIPAGQPGIPGPDVPALPSSGGDPITFTNFIPAEGMILPYVLTVNYRVQAALRWGVWEVPVSGDVMLTDGNGSSFHQPNGINAGKLIMYQSVVDTNGVVVGVTGPHDVLGSGFM